MYYYFASTVMGRRPKWKFLLTAAQVTQFVIDASDVNEPLLSLLFLTRQHSVMVMVSRFAQVAVCSYVAFVKVSEQRAWSIFAGSVIESEGGECGGAPSLSTSWAGFLRARVRVAFVWAWIGCRDVSCSCHRRRNSIQLPPPLHALLRPGAPACEEEREMRLRNFRFLLPLRNGSFHPSCEQAAATSYKVDHCKCKKTK